MCCADMIVQETVLTAQHMEESSSCRIMPPQRMQETVFCMRCAGIVLQEPV
jgi:hypothetical protein